MSCHDTRSVTHHAGCVPGGASLGGGACGSSMRSSRSGSLSHTEFTARLTGQRHSTSSPAGRIRDGAPASSSPSHAGQRSAPGSPACARAAAPWCCSRWWSGLRKCKPPLRPGCASPPIFRRRPAPCRPAGQSRRTACRRGSHDCVADLPAGIGRPSSPFDLRLREADIFRPPELKHPVHCVCGNGDLGRSTPIGVRSQPGPEDP